jgi:hypothetical protein
VTSPSHGETALSSLIWRDGTVIIDADDADNDDDDPNYDSDDHDDYSDSESDIDHADDNEAQPDDIDLPITGVYMKRHKKSHKMSH